MNPIQSYRNIETKLELKLLRSFKHVLQTLIVNASDV